MIAISIAVSAPGFALTLHDVQAAIDGLVCPVTDLAHVSMWFLQEIKHLSKLLVEGLSMESVVMEGTNKIEPIDPARAQVLNAEMLKSNERLNALAEKLKQNASNAKKQGR